MDKLYSKDEYVTTAIENIKIYRFLEDINVGDYIKACQIESVHDRIPKPVDQERIPSNLDGDFFFKHNPSGTVCWHTEDGWR